MLTSVYYIVIKQRNNQPSDKYVKCLNDANNRRLKIMAYLQKKDNSQQQLLVHKAHWTLRELSSTINPNTIVEPEEKKDVDRIADTGFQAYTSYNFEKYR